jgi:hypothetical protein
MYSDSYQFQQDFVNIFACMREATQKSGDEFVEDTMSYVETKIV